MKNFSSTISKSSKWNFSGHTEIVKFLLQNKGKAELLDSDGKSALDKAIENNHKDVIEIVKKYLENK